MQKQHPNKKGILSGRVMRTVGRTLLVIILTVVLIAAFLVGVMAIVVHGPSPAAQRLFVLSTKETSAIGFLPHIFLSDEEVEEILHPTPPVTEPEPVDTFVEMAFEDGTTTESAQETVSVDSTGNVNSNATIEMVEIREALFNGKMLIIPDPSKVVIGTLDSYSYNVGGKYLYEFIEEYGAIGGTNAGGFYDPNGRGDGSIPDTMVVVDGQVYYPEFGVGDGFVGIDSNHILHVGKPTAAEIREKDIRTGVGFGPVLISNGEAVPSSASGINPRTGIGQRSDGAILMLVIDGRQVSSLGATFADMTDIFLSYGAVNACNLDGGSSSMMWYQGDYVNHCASVVGIRPVPTTFLVLKEGVSGND